MDEQIKIESGIPLPSKNGTHKFPFKELEIGQSFFVRDGVIKNSSVLAGYGNKHNAPKRFAGRKLIESGVSGTRIWRIA